MDIVQNTPDLRTRQIALEEESLTLGIDRYKKEHERQDEADTGPGIRLIRDTLGPVSAAIDAFVAEARNGKPGKKHTAVRWVEKFPSSELAYLTVRHCLNAVSSKDTRVQTVAEAIAVAVEDSINYSRFREESPGLYKHLQGVLKKSTSKRHNKNVMSAAMRRTELGQFSFPDIGDLPRRELEPVPALPVAAEDMDAWKELNPEAFKAWKRKRADVYETNARATSKRVAAAQKIALASRFEPEQAIYFPHSLDFRGRVYPVPGRRDGVRCCRPARVIESRLSVRNNKFSMRSARTRTYRRRIYVHSCSEGRRTTRYGAGNG